MKRIVLIVLVVFFSIGFDQVSKSIARSNINYNETIYLLNDNIVLKKVDNTGAAFGLGANSPILLKIFYLQLIPIVILLFLFRLIIFDTEFSKLTIVGTSLLIGGAAGNLFDRLFFRSVTDFIQLNITGNKTIIFNIADIIVVCGLVLAIIGLTLNHKKKV